MNPSYYKMKNGQDLNDMFEAGLIPHVESFYMGNIIKYTVRHKNKNGLEDLEKAKTYLDRLIKYEEANANDKFQRESRNYPGDRSLAD